MKELRVMLIVTITDIDESTYQPVEDSKVDGFKIGDRQFISDEHHANVYARGQMLSYLVDACHTKAMQEIAERWRS